MNRRFTNLVLAITTVVILGLMPAANRSAGAGQSGPAVDHRLYGELLSRHVVNGLVNYRGLLREESKLDRYLDQMARIDPERLERPERFAFYVNLYNAWTIKLILSRYPDLESIKDLGSLFRSPWKRRIVRLDGKRVTLDEIEHGILRPQFHDPRVHFALNCASLGCPPLRAEPFRGAVLDRQLDEQVRSNINDPRRTHLRANVLYLNRVFDWYGEDFPRGPIAFVERYARGKLKRALVERAGAVTVEFLPWDWRLNDAGRYLPTQR